MYVAHLTLHDFRSYADLEVELAPGATAFVGRNGQGKTNLVEAIDYLSRLGSHRVATDAPLVRAGAERALVRAAVVRDGRQAVLEVEITPGRSNRARVNRSDLPRARDLLGPGPHGGLLARGPHPRQGRPVGPAAVPRRPAGAAHAAAGRRPLRLRPGPAAAQLAAQDRRPRPRELARVGAVDAGGVGRPPRPGRRGAARGPAAAGRPAAAVRRQGVRDRRPRRVAGRRVARLRAVLRPRRERRPTPTAAR